MKQDPMIQIRRKFLNPLRKHWKKGDETIMCAGQVAKKGLGEYKNVIVITDAPNFCGRYEDFKQAMADGVL